jgi:hypothetical protein
MQGALTYVPHEQGCPAQSQSKKSGSVLLVTSR